MDADGVLWRSPLEYIETGYAMTSTVTGTRQNSVKWSRTGAPEGECDAYGGPQLGPAPSMSCVRPGGGSTGAKVLSRVPAAAEALTHNGALNRHLNSAQLTAAAVCLHIPSCGSPC